MSTRLRIPPSHRDFQVHRFLAVEGGSTREAAVRFGVSQTRVRQLARRVVQWAAETLPPEVEAELAGLMRVAESVAADRLEHHYQETMEQWRMHHQPKFLNLALRVTAASAKFPRRSYEMEAVAADLLEGPEEEPVGWDQLAERAQAHQAGTHGKGGGPAPAAGLSHPTPTPLDRACSGEGRNGSAAPPREIAGRDASPRPASKLVALMAGDAAGKPELESRVRTLLSPAGEAATSELQVTPESIGLSVEETLQRFQRRKRKAK